MRGAYIIPPSQKTVFAGTAALTYDSFILTFGLDNRAGATTRGPDRKVTPEKPILRSAATSDADPAQTRRTIRPGPLRLRLGCPNFERPHQSIIPLVATIQRQNTQVSIIAHTLLDVVNGVFAPDAVIEIYMAGSRESPGLRDEWRAPQKPGGTGRERDFGRGRGRGAEHDRGRNRNRGKYRPGGFGHRSKSPAAARRPPSSSNRDFAYERGPSFAASTKPRGSSRSPSVSRIDRDMKRSYHGSQTPSRNSPPQRDHDHPDSYPKRRWSRSRSPPDPQQDRYPDSRNNRHSSRGRTNNRGKSQRRDRFQDTFSKSHTSRRGKPDRFGSRREDDLESISQPVDSLSSYAASRRGSRPDINFRRSTSRDSVYEDRFERGQSRHSARSTYSRYSRSVSPNHDRQMSPPRHFQPFGEESKRSPSRSAQTFEAGDHDDGPDNDGRGQASISKHSSRLSDAHVNQRGRQARGHLESHQYPSPHHASYNSPYHDSPQSGSPHSSNRGGRAGQHGNHSPQYRSQGPLHGPNANHQQSSYPNSPQRGSHHRSSYQDRRFGSQSYSGSTSHRGRGHFSNLQWVASGSQNRGDHTTSPGSHSLSGSSTPQVQHQLNEKPLDDSEDYHNASHHAEDMPMEDAEAKREPENENVQEMPPPERPSGISTTSGAKEGGKFSFAFKSKAAPAPATKPVPDLAQRMQVRDPPRAPGPPPPRHRPPGPLPPPKFSKNDFRPERRERDRDRDFHRGRGRDFRDRNPRDSRREDRRFDSHDDRRRDGHRPDARQDRRRERSPEPKKQKRMVKRLKPRPTLPEEYRDSESVYYRKPGNESVIGAGTYGKVFKAIHIYTQGKVALKRIRMEGEKDGFPVTAIREIKLLQHLRHNNIVSLLEVMVEKNECFMVFEYLSHDLTGLINHPTFTLTEAHKKDLAKQMFEGLHYLHHRGVLHRDIKAANILISNRGQLKYADFGLARFFSKSRQLDYTNRVITIWYRPPELLLGDTQYGPAVDIWSAACVFVEMFSKKAVFPGDGREISQLDKLYSSLGTPTRADWPNIVDMPWFELLGPTERKKRVFDDMYKNLLSPAALDLVSKIFQYDPMKRPTAEEVLAHEYFVAEEPGPQQAIELENIQGDWHEFESKALRKEKDREARREKDKEKEKRKANSQDDEREAKRPRQEVDDAQGR